MIAIITTALLAVGLANANKAEAWLNRGPDYAYPSVGGTWQYGFWNVRARSNYIVNRRHGSTVKVDNRTSRSICTRGGRWSLASTWAVDYPGAWDRYYYRLC